MNKKFKILIRDLPIAAVSIIGSDYLKKQSAAEELAEQRKVHTTFLKETPLKESLKWSKKERKQIELPLNRYFNQNAATNNTIYTGGVSGSLWKNIEIGNANSQWTRKQNVPGNLSVTSITVDRWYAGTTVNSTINTSSLKTGIYLLEANDGKKSLITKSTKSTSN
ncbi:hypothetical protein TSEDIMI_90004 [Tenacibaculum sediminilitoris]|uniref:hypothetical protein n=1 Tax=Tenacibaculum sediminilitoris TaxID=1820334 RepID=UPI0038943AD9